MRRGGAFTPFAHALFGGFHSSASASGISASDSGFALMLGGGADVKVAPAISVRLLQFDWLSLHANGNSDNNNMRLSTGVVFHFYEIALGTRRRPRPPFFYSDELPHRLF